MDEVTLFITACNRADLLYKTLDSFIKHNTYPIKKCIIIEDSGNIGINDFAITICPFPVETIYNEKNIGQIPSIEKGYSKISTDYIFHCEDDWEFFKPGFIEASLEILKNDSKVVTVGLRSYEDFQHPRESLNLGGYHYLNTHHCGIWHGFTLNPGLRRLSDYTKVAPWSESCRGDFERKGVNTEDDLSILYYKHGYRGAITADSEGYVRHIGWDRHVWRPQDTKEFYEKYY